MCSHPIFTRIAALAATLFLALTSLPANAQQPAILGAQTINSTSVELQLRDGKRMTVDFYGNSIFRLFYDPKGGIVRDPQATPPAQILVSNPRTRLAAPVTVTDSDGKITVGTDPSYVQVVFDKASGLMQVLQNGELVVEQIAPVAFSQNGFTMKLRERDDEYFYGGGVQNGRFSHKGKAIAIENQNSWTDGGVASPTPFFWSTRKYGAMFYTFKKGKYDFGAAEKGVVALSHESPYLDVFFMTTMQSQPYTILSAFYQLTGHPVLLPKFGFYEGHLNAYNRDFWAVDSTQKGILFEDGKYYKESQKDNGGTKESLNGEKQNYMFSARAVVDRYAAHDMPLGWILPNDGYGAGYGQTETLDGNIANLKNFGDYARAHGVEIGLWTQSDLHPIDSIPALLQRDIVKEVRDAGVRVLKTDVAWVGAGYSFGLNGVADAADIMPRYGNDARPFIISLDGWAGTQRYATVWSGDQTGGLWEYIRFHIPTYIGSGLSGQPNITSDMDGIFGGRNATVNIRDFQWKTFSPMQLNMDGWGTNAKYPHILGEPAASINRCYLKWKSELLPYAYDAAHAACTDKPLISAMFIDYPNDYTHGTATQYQYMFGDYFLVAPIYQNTKADAAGNDIRNGIYLPKGTWIDYFTGEQYEGERVLNSFDAPIWKLPVFVKAGAIIPLANPSNHVGEIDSTLRIFEFYPDGESYFTFYDDDGRTQAYLRGKYTRTFISCKRDEANKVTIKIGGEQGDEKPGLSSHPKSFLKCTELRINATAKPKSVRAKNVNVRVNKATKLRMKEVFSLEEFEHCTHKDVCGNVYFYDSAPAFNRFATPGSEFAKQHIARRPQLRIRLETAYVDEHGFEVEIDGYAYNIPNRARRTEGTLAAPKAAVRDANITAYTLTPTWAPVPNADFYEIEHNGMLYSTIRDTALIFASLTPETTCTFKVRAANKSGSSPWTTIAATTKRDPLEHAIHGLTGETSVPNQGRSLQRLFDFKESGDVWHTRYRAKAVPFSLIVDLHSVNTLDKLWYLPRPDAGNGTLLRGKVSCGMTKEAWTPAGEFTWARSGETKTFSFAAHPTARYIKLDIDSAVGDYGSGTELYVFRVPGTESWLPGDINNDGHIDENDLTSYLNYTGLRRSDADFGYIARGDINRNGLIDAYDISNVAVALDGGADRPDAKLAGTLAMKADKPQYKAGDTIKVTIYGDSLAAVNALSFALPYNQADCEYIGITPVAMQQMENFTYDRLHTNGTKSLYPTFVNRGAKPALAGSGALFTIKLRAKKSMKFGLHMTDVRLVDAGLDELK